MKSVPPKIRSIARFQAGIGLVESAFEVATENVAMLAKRL
jgi:hypothetical protein